MEALVTAHGRIERLGGEGTTMCGVAILITELPKAVNA